MSINVISLQQVEKSYGTRLLFTDVDITFTTDQRYGLVGINGTGKSTFLKILAGEIDSSSGDIIIEKNKRMSFLKQDHFAYEEISVLNVVMMGHEKLYEIMQKKDALYSKSEFTEEDGMIAAELEGEFAELDGWEAETNAEKFLVGLGIMPDLHHKLMKELTEPEKVKVLLAQALFGKPEILIMDEPTNHLDFQSINWLNNFIMDLEDSIVIVVSHDRHFLNQICTNIVDVDFGKIQMYVGNYDFWYESSQLMQRLIKDQNKKAEQKIQPFDLLNFSKSVKVMQYHLLVSLYINFVRPILSHILFKKLPCSFIIFSSRPCLSHIPIHSSQTHTWVFINCTSCSPMPH